MSSITIPLSDQTLAELQTRAEQLGMTPQEYLQRVVEQLLETPDDEFQQAAGHVLKKNNELYRRLS